MAHSEVVHMALSGPPGILCLFCGFPGASPALIYYLCPKLHPERGMLSVCLKIISPAAI
jgi:hypothetical protein